MKGPVTQTRPKRKVRRRKPPPGSATPSIGLPDPFSSWFQSRGWQPREHQLALVSAAKAQRNTLLIAPTGAGKTLAGFLPSLLDLAAQPTDRPAGLHTLYVSPLKALAVDVARNLLTPIDEMELPFKVETRTGDTPAGRRQRQRLNPPDMLLTTPEQIALMLSHADAPKLFAGLRTVILDELHALVTSKRGDLLALGLARLRAFAPDLMTIGLSATVARPSELRAYLEPQPADGKSVELSHLVSADGGRKPDIRILECEDGLPWTGHSARYATDDMYKAVKAHKLVLLFVNTRSQAELVFQELWRVNDDNLPIALHHGSLDVGRRRKVERAMADGQLRAVVATSTLDLGIDWGDVDLVINVGAPKGASRLIQRIGRSNHRLDEPSKALLVPANRFEVLECRAALEAAEVGDQDTQLNRLGGRDVLAQHVLGVACGAPFDPDALYREVATTQPYTDLTRAEFDRIIDFVATGGYALRTYERYARLRKTPEGLLRIANPRIAQQYRLNVGTIVEAPMIKVRLTKMRRRSAKSAGPGAISGGRVLGEVEEWFIEQLAPGDTFRFAGEVVRLEGLRDTEAFVSRAGDADPKIPSYMGGKFPLSTHLAERVRRMLADEQSWANLPSEVSEWLGLQKAASVMPSPDQVLIETFPRGARNYMVCYPFEGRLVHQTLGMLLTRRLERLRARPLGFVANDYALAVWGLGDLSRLIEMGKLDLAALFEEDMLGDDLDAWLASSALMKRTFRVCAVISGLIERRHPGKEKSGRQITVSTDLIYDVLRQHEPDHILLQAAWADAATGLLDISRLGDFLARIKGRIEHIALDQVSPLSVPVLLEIGREPVRGGIADDLLRESAQALIADVMGQDTHAGTENGRTSS